MWPLPSTPNLKRFAPCSALQNQPRDRRSRRFSAIFAKTQGFMPLVAVLLSDYSWTFSEIRIGVAGERWPATTFQQGTRRHGARWMRPSGWISAGSGHIPKDSAAADGLIRRELDLCDCDRSARLVVAIRHFGCGYVVYRPVILEGALPAHEEAAAALFALAAISPEPVPVLARSEDAPFVRRADQGNHAG
jgi:hypothetical protein